MDKTKCYDIFQRTKVQKMRMYHTRSIKDVMFYSTEMKKLDKKLKRIQVVKRMGYKILSSYGNPTYIQLALQEIKLVK